MMNPSMFCQINVILGENGTEIGVLPLDFR